MNNVLRSLKKTESPLDLQNFRTHLGTRISIFAGPQGKIFLSQNENKKARKIHKEKSLT